MNCIEKLLEANDQFEVEEPGYYKLVCNNLERKTLDVAQLSELSPLDIEMSEKVLYCFQNVGHDIETSRIHLDFCHLVHRRLRPNLEITLEQAMFELGHIPHLAEP